MTCLHSEMSELFGKSVTLPELLSPAGGLKALEAAIEGGADAVYIGGTSFNARMNAENFNAENIEYAVNLAHRYCVKIYQTINTLVFDRELKDFLKSAEKSAQAGVDAFIVADLGAAAMLHKYFPEIPLHASTQLSAHNSAAGGILQKLGFSRMVPARELSYENIKSIVHNNPLEIEIFIHGALCVSHSGQCLFSSVVGGRSGNRGLCAQPCRLPYSARGGKRKGNPLSLKDMSYANHVTQIIESGVKSLKIEGRMKSAEYVYKVTSIWRRLLDERRNAEKSEMEELAGIFSRDGFTDAYFTSSISEKMLGVRRDKDKEDSRRAEKFKGLSKKIPVSMKVTVDPEKHICLSVFCGEKNVTVYGVKAQKAVSAPIGENSIIRSMSRLGDTSYILENIEINLAPDTMVPVSRLNELRRMAIEALEVEDVRKEKISLPENIVLDKSLKKRERKNSARFLYPEQITKKAKEYFSEIYLPLDKYEINADGFVMPPVITDKEVQNVLESVNKAVSTGAQRALISNIGQIEFLKNHDIETVGDYRLNASNSCTVNELEKLVMKYIILSPELSLPQRRDISGNVCSVVYGRLPLMLLEKCVIKDLYGCESCRKNSPEKITALVDRRGVEFPVIRQFPHRNIVLNSLPTSMSDREDELMRANIVNRHFIFTTETPKEVDMVIDAFEKKTALPFAVRRI